MAEGYSKLKTETVITYNDAENEAGIYTGNRALLNKLRSLAEQYPNECRLEHESRGGDFADYIVPKKWVKVSPPRKVNLSDEQRAQIAERLKSSRKSIDVK